MQKKRYKHRRSKKSSFISKIVIALVIALVVFVVRQGDKYLPQVPSINKLTEDTGVVASGKPKVVTSTQQQESRATNDTSTTPRQTIPKSPTPSSSPVGDPRISIAKCEAQTGTDGLSMRYDLATGKCVNQSTQGTAQQRFENNKDTSTGTTSPTPTPSSSPVGDPRISIAKCEAQTGTDGLSMRYDLATGKCVNQSTVPSAAERIAEWKAKLHASDTTSGGSCKTLGSPAQAGSWVATGVGYTAEGKVCKEGEACPKRECQQCNADGTYGQKAVCSDLVMAGKESVILPAGAGPEYTIGITSSDYRKAGSGDYKFNLYACFANGKQYGTGDRSGSFVCLNGDWLTEDAYKVAYPKTMTATCIAAGLAFNGKSCTTPNTPATPPQSAKPGESVAKASDCPYGATMSTPSSNTSSTYYCSYATVGTLVSSQADCSTGVAVVAPTGSVKPYVCATKPTEAQTTCGKGYEYFAPDHKTINPASNSICKVVASPDTIDRYALTCEASTIGNQYDYQTGNCISSTSPLALTNITSCTPNRTTYSSDRKTKTECIKTAAGTTYSKKITFCQVAFDAAGTCPPTTPKVLEGGTCTSTADCGANLYCEDPWGARTCKPMSEALQPGASCQAWTQECGKCPYGYQDGKCNLTLTVSPNETQMSPIPSSSQGSTIGLKKAGELCGGVNADKACLSGECSWINDKNKGSHWFCMAKSTFDKPANATSDTNSSGKKYNGTSCKESSECASNYCAKYVLGADQCANNPFALSPTSFVNIGKDDVIPAQSVRNSLTESPFGLTDLAHIGNLNSAPIVPENGLPKKTKAEFSAMLGKACVVASPEIYIVEQRRCQVLCENLKTVESCYDLIPVSKNEKYCNGTNVVNGEGKLVSSCQNGCQDGQCLQKLTGQSCGQYNEVKPTGNNTYAYCDPATKKWQPYAASRQFIFSDFCPNSYRSAYLKGAVAIQMRLADFKEKPLYFDCGGTSSQGGNVGGRDNVTMLCDPIAYPLNCGATAVHELMHAWAFDSNNNTSANVAAYSNLIGCKQVGDEKYEYSKEIIVDDDQQSTWIEYKDGKGYSQINCQEAFALGNNHYVYNGCYEKENYPIQYQWLKDNIYHGVEYCTNSEASQLNTLPIDTTIHTNSRINTLTVAKQNGDYSIMPGTWSKATREGITVNQRGCGPLTVYNVLNYQERNPDLNTVYENYNWTCTNNGCSTNVDQVLVELGSPNSYKNPILDTTSIKNKDGIYLYGGTVSGNEGSQVPHIAAFVVESGSVYALDSYFGENKPVACTKFNADSIQCGSTTYSVRSADATGGTADALYYLSQ